MIDQATTYTPGRVKPYTVKEVTELLPIGKTAVYDACERGDIPHTRIGAKVLIPASFVDRAISGQDSNPA